MSTPMVSVVIQTWNHQAFIKQAVESALMQQTEFVFEILISEDCSTDATRNIVTAFRDRWPDRIKLLLSERNQGNNEVMTRCFDAARGKYIALLEGDDYWTSAKKLQKQVEFMEEHPECVTSFHAVEFVCELGVKRETATPARPKAISTLNDLLVQGCFIETAAVMFRRSALGEVPDWYRYREIFAQDWILHVLLARQGDIAYIDESMAAYRLHQGGVWTRLNTAERLVKKIAACEDLTKYLGRRGKPLKGVLSLEWKNLAVENVKQNHLEAAIACAGNGLKAFPTSPVLVAKLLLLRYAPTVWCSLKGKVQPS